MGILNVNIDNKLDRAFRMELVRRFDGRKGSIQKGVEEALRMWINPIWVQDLKEDKARAFIDNMNEMYSHSHLQYFSGETKYLGSGHVGIYYKVIDPERN